MYTDRFSFYRSSEWQGFRDVYKSARLLRDGELICDKCHKAIVNAYEAILHHKVELDEVNVFDSEIALNEDNIELLCRDCHNKEHDRFGYSAEKRVFIVWGSPCAGKIEYVDEVATKGDLIVDIDRLYDAMGACGNRGAVKGNVLSVYRQLIDMVRTRNGRWRNAWIVRGLPLRVDREGLVRECLNAELIHIDTPEEICLQRAKARSDDWVKWTREWWEKYDGGE